MSTRSYEVTGEHAAPLDFQDYVLRQFPQRVIHITARPLEVDELAVRRGEEPEQIEFDLRIGALYGPVDDFVVQGSTKAFGEKTSWIKIEVKESVRFDILD